MGKLIAILVLVLALAGGAAAGHFLRPPPDISEDGDETETLPEPKPLNDAAAIAKFSDPFIVPILRNGQIWSHVVISLGVEALKTTQEDIYSQEPILRDGLNEVLFLHGNLGGFDGDFTEQLALNRLRMRLNDVVANRLADDTARILITSLARQSR